MRFTITYEPREMCGEQGFDWKVTRDGKLVAEGWSKGKRRHAEQDAAAVVNRKAA